MAPAFYIENSKIILKENHLFRRLLSKLIIAPEVHLTPILKDLRNQYIHSYP